MYHAAQKERKLPDVEYVCTPEAGPLHHCAVQVDYVQGWNTYIQHLILNTLALIKKKNSEIQYAVNPLAIQTRSTWTQKKLQMKQRMVIQPCHTLEPLLLLPMQDRIS